MKRSGARILVAGFVLSTAFSLTTSQAASLVVCSVGGSVNLVSPVRPNSTSFTSLPLDENRRIGAYRFIETNLKCEGSFSGVYTVTAQGTSTGIAAPGENCDEGQNHVAGTGTGYGTSTGGNGISSFFTNTLTASRTSGSGPLLLNATVAFKRLGTAVHVDGNFTSGLPGGSFTADLQFTPGGRTGDLPQPAPDQATGCAPSLPGGVVTAALDGIAVIKSAS